jgi:hypothetical protein
MRMVTPVATGAVDEKVSNEVPYGWRNSIVNHVLVVRWTRSEDTVAVPWISAGASR